MKKIAFIVVIVACVASLGLVWKVAGIKKAQKNQIAELDASLKDTSDKLAKTKTDLATTKTELGQTQGKLADTETKLSAANVALEEKTKTVANLEGKVANLDKRVSETTARLTEAEGTLRRIRDAVGIEGEVTADQLRQKLTAQADENKMLGDLLAKLQKSNVELQELAATPEGLKAQVAVVEEKWGFVVLDIGYTKKVHREAQFVIYRDSQLIAKVQVTSVGPSTCIAQILPGYKRGAPRVGDWVTR